MKPKPPKKIWKIRTTEEGQFYLVDENDSIVSPTTGTQSRHKLFELATDKGADEVKHDYDNVKYP